MKFKIAILSMALFLVACSRQEGGGSTLSSPDSFEMVAMEVPQLQLDSLGTTSLARYSGESVEFDAQSMDALGSDTMPLNPSQMLITIGNLDLVVEDFDDVSSDIDRLVNSSRGYVEQYELRFRTSHNVDYRVATMTLRIPSNGFGRTVEEIRSLGDVITHNFSVQDVTVAHFDTTAALEAKIAERERLLVFLESAQTIAEILEIERRFNSVSSEIGILESRIRRMDLDVAFSTLHLTIYEDFEIPEIHVPEPITFVERLSDGFIASVNGTLIFLQYLVLILVVLFVPILIPAAITLVIIYYVLKNKKAKRIKKEESKQE